MAIDTATQTLHGQTAKFAAGFQELDTQTWAWLQPNGLLGESNAGLIASGEQLLLIDTLWDLRLTQRMLDAAKGLTGMLPQTVFNTHSDGDHVWGNQLLPDARIISSAKAKELMALDTPKELLAMQRGGRMLAKLGSLPIPLIGTRDFGGLPRLPLREMGNEFAPFDWSAVELTLPTQTFEGSMTLEIGDRTVELIEVGPAHTGGDSVAWVPDAKVCFAADILFINGTPIMWAGPIAGWISALDRISELGAESFVPGHGPICGQQEVDQLRAYFEWINEQGSSLLARGFDPAHAARQMLFSDEFSNAPWAQWDDAARLVVTLSSEHHLREGGSGHLFGAARTKAIIQMQRTKADLARRARQGATR